LSFLIFENGAFEMIAVVKRWSLLVGLKEAYSHAYVTGYDRDYLWFLSRKPEVSEKAIESFKDRARAEGFDLEELIVVEQEKHRSQR
tara:strand:- start:1160 stop:1420 length:261 start_codon:yes stop_codon:yes gene_type:complete